ncbi:unnamed protein product [Mytilus edulis]|uniref:JmjC domain-containing protein n=1 Tax=Mytilus edulis TaxID=6550 RepID=A0A8S3S627_MYTED|nr:unnamed protein product [Mytilus edulis]
METEEIENDIIELINEWPITQDTKPLYKGSSKTAKNLQDKPNGAEFDSKRTIDYSNEITSNCKRNIEAQVLDSHPKRRKYSGEKESLANTALAKWWRRNQSQCGTEDTAAVKGCHPNTLIKVIARSPAEAIFHLEMAVKGAPEEKEYKWLLQKLKRILKIKTIQEKGLQRVKPGGEFPSFKQVDRISAQDLTVEEFFHNYECTSTPVIITNVQMTRVPWTLNHVKEIAGNCTVTLKKPVKQSVEWARLENSRTVPVSTYIDQIIDNTLAEPLYLFDWSLPINCPSLAKELTIPKYFAGDFLKRTEEGSLYKDSWPSLFVAPEGITSELHVDAFGSNFWMALFQGKKRWVFFPQSDVPYLYPEYEHSLDPVFAVDLSRPDLTQYPLLQLTTPIECVLEPGDVLFVPAGCPHRVKNLETSVAISSNFVDQSNFTLVNQELKINALMDIRSEELLRQFNNEKFNDQMDMHIQNKVFSEITLDTDCEICWNKIEIKGSKPLYTGCYYRPPDNNIAPIESLNTPLTRLTHSNNLPNLVLTEALEENCLTQIVKEPTRQDNILDLVLTTNPTSIENISVQDGMSDHSIVITDINLKAKTKKQVPRKVYIYKKGNMNGINEQLDKELNNFIQKANTSTIQECWNDFKDILSHAIISNIPTKILSTRWNVPWINREIKTMIRKKQRVYNKAKRTNNEKHWEEFKLLRKTVKTKLEEAHQNYISQLLEVDEEGERKTPVVGKKFWQYVKSKKRDSCGVAPLISNGKLMEDSKGKAEALNHQFVSVFTNENTSSKTKIKWQPIA